MFFFLFFEIISCVFILKQLFVSGSVIIGEYSPIITSPSANNCQIKTDEVEVFVPPIFTEPEVNNFFSIIIT